MENRIAVIGIIIENKNIVSKVNEILHENGDFIIGRMGIPYREKKYKYNKCRFKCSFG